MAAHRAEGIILKKYCLRETSFILVVYTREYGKICGVMKGVRNPHPQFAGNFEIFTKCEVLFYPKKRKGMDLITQCESLDFFFSARKEIERLTYANYFIELVDIATADYDVNEQLYDVLVKSLGLLNSDNSSKRICRIFELKFLEAVGVLPRLDKCIKCSAEVGDNIYFSVRSGGVVCPACNSRKEGHVKISLGTLNFMRKIHGLPFEKTQQIKVSKDVGRETERILKLFIEYHIGRQTKSMRFLGALERNGIIRGSEMGLSGIGCR
jgi:DNA repair protein RecO (recombination protein O)